MKKHCFYCWNDATHRHPDGIDVCEDHKTEDSAVLMPAQRLVD